jgi:hypothetical protein
MEITDANEIITAPSWSDGFEILSPTRLSVWTLDVLHGLTPPMLEWWFAHLDRAGYIAFNPREHEEFAWVRGKEPGRYVGATHLTHQRHRGSGPLIRAEVTFLPPQDRFDPAVAESHAAGFTLSAVVHLLDDAGDPEPDAAHHFVHVGIAREYGTELRSCWWLDVDEQSDIERLTTERFRHVHEDFGYLADFLPNTYETRSQR